MNIFRVFVSSGLAILAATTTQASAWRLSDAMSRADEVHIRRLTTRLEWPRPWAPDSVLNWALRSSQGERSLTSRQRARLAEGLADTILKKPRHQLPLGLLIGPEDCDFLIMLRGAAGTTEVLLSFPEALIRIRRPDSSFSGAGFEDGAVNVIDVLKECFPLDSTVQDLPAATGWYFHHAGLVGDPYFEGVPSLEGEFACDYPDVQHISGVFTVHVEALVDRRGGVTRARVKQGYPMLDEGALECVRHWRFRPAMFDGHPFGFRLTIPVEYKFESLH